MEQRMYKMAGMLLANGFGFGKYWNGYIFGKTAKDPHFIYLCDNKMAILSAGIDEDGEKSILKAADELSKEELNDFFNLDYDKQASIEWLGKKINMILLCDNADEVKKNTIYFTWPAIDLEFTEELKRNTIVVYDRFTPKETIEKRIKEANDKDISKQVEFWTMLKLISFTDRFGEFAPKICIESIPG